MAPPLSVIKIVKYCGVRGGGGIGDAKIPQKIVATPLSVIKIIKYCGKKYIAYKQYNCILPIGVLRGGAKGALPPPPKIG